jgi:hypothetical protein
MPWRQDLFITVKEDHFPLNSCSVYVSAFPYPVVFVWFKFTLINNLSSRVKGISKKLASSLLITVAIYTGIRMLIISWRFK